MDGSLQTCLVITSQFHVPLREFQTNQLVKIIFECKYSINYIYGKMLIYLLNQLLSYIKYLMNTNFKFQFPIESRLKQLIIFYMDPFMQFIGT